MVLTASSQFRLTQDLSSAATVSNALAMSLFSRLSLGLVSGLVSLAIITATSGASAASAEPQAYSTSVSAAVGALFSVDANGALGNHFCTASVVDSPRGNLVLTAAHCLDGRTPGSFVFVPDYFRGIAPLGVWVVEKTFVDAEWASSSSPDDDFAFLVVSQPGSRWSLEALTGGERLGAPPVSPKLTSVVGYPASVEAPIACQNSLLDYSLTQFEFDCGGYVDGTSGSALVVDPDANTGLGIVVGVIGGYQAGGDTPSISYAAAFGLDTEALYQQAINSQ